MKWDSLAITREMNAAMHAVVRACVRACVRVCTYVYKYAFFLTKTPADVQMLENSLIHRFVFTM